MIVLCCIFTPIIKLLFFVVFLCFTCFFLCSVVFSSDSIDSFYVLFIHSLLFVFQFSFSLVFLWFLLFVLVLQHTLYIQKTNTLLSDFQILFFTSCVIIHYKLKWIYLINCTLNRNIVYLLVSIEAIIPSVFYNKISVYLTTLLKEISYTIFIKANQININHQIWY